MAASTALDFANGFDFFAVPMKDFGAGGRQRDGTHVLNSVMLFQKGLECVQGRDECRRIRRVVLLNESL